MGRLRGDRANGQERKREQFRRWAELHQERVGKRWDRSLKLMRAIDFSAVSSKRQLKDLVKTVHRWRELTLRPVRRLTPLARTEASIEEGEDGEDYLCRVLIGIDLENFDTLCENLVKEVRSVDTQTLPVAHLDWRDRLVELMETGVRASTRALDWIDTLGKATETVSFVEAHRS